VRVAAPASFAPTLQRFGFTHEPLPDVAQAELGSVFGRLATLSRPQANALVVEEIFGRLNTRAALPAMRAVCDSWKPDVVLREPAELSSYVAALERGVPHVQTNIGLSSFDDFLLPLFEAPLKDVGCDTASLRAAPRWTTLPPTFDVASRLVSGTVTHARDVLPHWWDGSDDPLVYVTFGSVAAGMGLFPRFYERVLEQLSGVPVRVLLTLGEAGDPMALGTVPANVHIERWWPQRDVMAHAAVIVGHGGATQAALVAGVPQVAIPLFSYDQFANAERLQAVGVGLKLTDAASHQGGVMSAGPQSVDRLAEALERVLEDEDIRRTSQSLANEARALPSAEECVEAGIAAL